MVDNNAISPTTCTNKVEDVPNETMRINDLDRISDENISLSMAIAVDYPEETFKVDFKQVVDYIKNELINKLILVGDMIISKNKETPKERGLTGQWSKLDDGVTISSISPDSEKFGKVTGNNNVDVPLLTHTHHAESTSNSSFKGNKLPTHAHSVNYSAQNAPNELISSGGGTNTHHKSTTSAQSAGIPSGSISTSTTTLISSTGDEKPQINIQSTRLNVVIWIKTAM